MPGPHLWGVLTRMGLPGEPAMGRRCEEWREPGAGAASLHTPGLRLTGLPRPVLVQHQHDRCLAGCRACQGG